MKLVRLYVNFFQPICKLVSKERVGAKVIKRYDRAATPYQRLLATGVVPTAKREQLKALYQSLDPLKLRAGIDALLLALRKEADRPAARSA